MPGRMLRKGNLPFATGLAGKKGCASSSLVLAPDCVCPFSLGVVGLFCKALNARRSFNGPMLHVCQRKSGKPSVVFNLRVMNDCRSNTTIHNMFHRGRLERRFQDQQAA